MSDSIPREWRFYLDDMIGFAEKVIAYTEGFNQNDFITNGLAYDATLRNLELIGEAAMRIPDTVRTANMQIPWRQNPRVGGSIPLLATIFLHPS